MVNAKNHNYAAIEQRYEGLVEKLNMLNRAAERRKAHLNDHWAFMQFMWKTDVVESWIADREIQVCNDDYGRDLSSVQTLLTKHNTFDTALVSFQSDGIQTITDLHDQLIAAKHAQSPAIRQRLVIGFNFIFLSMMGLIIRLYHVCF